MLLGNYSVLNRNPIRYLGGSTTSPEVNHQPSTIRGGARKNRQYVGQTTAANKQFSLPYGSYPNNMTLLPQTGGDLASRRSADFSFTASATGGLGMPGEGSTSFSITTNTPDGQLIVSGDGSVTFAITGNDSALTASIGGEASATFTITVDDALLGALANLIGESTFSITGDLTSYAIGIMEGSALPYTELSPQSLAAAVVEASQTTPLYADIRKVSGTEITGSGTTVDPWGP